MSLIYDLSWNENSFLSKLKLFFASRKQECLKIWSDNKKVQAEGYSALSSTYYSIAGTAFSRLGMAFRRSALAPFRIIAWLFTWLPLTLWCYWRMLPLSNRVLETIGYDGMSADQCDIRQSILRRRGLHEEAESCIHVALAKNPEKAHTRGLLRVALAQIVRSNDDWVSAEREATAALSEAEAAEKQDPRQAVRIYRQCADVFLSVERIAIAQSTRDKAETLAKETGAQDQILKM